jgi:hypothetical protein
VTVGIAPGRAKPRWLGLLVACTVLTLIGASVVSAFPPGPTTGNKDPFNPTDAVADCNPPPNLNVATAGTAEVTNTCDPGLGNVHVTWISDTVSGSATDNAWGQGDKSDCFRAKTGGDATACVTQVFGIGASKTDLQYHGIGLEKGTDGHDYLYSGIKRLQAGGITSSNANYNVEVNQLLPAYKPTPESSICPTGQVGGCNIWRSPGDLTFMTDWGGNQSSCDTATPAICAYVWIDKSTGTGKTPSPAASTCFNAKTDPCWGLLPNTAADISANPDKAFGSINSGSATQPFTFTEIGVDLTASGLVGSGECRTFKDVWAHSRSSSSFTAELKDFIFGDVSISTCTTTDTSLQQVACVTPFGNIGSAAKTLNLALSVGGSVCVKDIATVGGGATSGNVDFRYYTTQALCEASDAATTGTDVSTNAVNSSGVATSDRVTFSTTGTRYFRAFFSGGGLSSSASQCDEIVVVTQNTTTSTELHESTSGGADVNPTQNGLDITILLGGYVRDIATVAPSSATGSVSFRYYTSSTACEADTAGSAGTDAGANKTVSSGTATSDTKQFNSVGDFYWRAFFTGTSPNNSSISACNEVVHVVKVDTGTTTQLHVSTSGGADVNPTQNGLEVTILLGGYVRDVATVTPTAATGSVSFRIYTSGTACNADTTGAGGTDAGAGKTVSSGTATSDTKQFNSVGDFYWRAFFTGTGPYNNSVSLCNEIVHVQKVDVGIATSPWYYPNDTVTITAPNGGGTPTGTLSFRLYNSLANCQANGNTAATGLLYSEENVALPANGIKSTSNTTVAVSTSGTVYWRVAFTSSNLAQNNASSACIESINATLNPDPVPAP